MKSRVASAHQPAAQSQAAPGGAVAPLQTLRFALYDAGVLPREAHARPGRVRVVITDYTSGTEGLTVEREVGNSRQGVGQVGRSGGTWRGERELALGAGRYRVCDAGRPTNCAALLVEE